MALIPPLFLDCVVAIGVMDSTKEIRWVASGFLYGHLRCKREHAGRSVGGYGVYLATNRHVLEGQDKAYLRFNPEASQPARTFVVDLQVDPSLGPGMVAHPDPDIDLALCLIDTGRLDAEGIRYTVFAQDRYVADRKAFEDLAITEGDFVYVLGFPMELVGKERNFVVVRQGVIARVRDYLEGVSKEFLIDCTVFPGNSGSPVVNKPEASWVQGTKPQNAAYLLGIAAGYIPYTDIAISQQTGKPRVAFEENSGLSSVVPAQYLIDLAESVEQRRAAILTERGQDPNV